MKDELGLILYPSFLIPHPSFLIPHPSFLIPHPSVALFSRLHPAIAYAYCPLYRNVFTQG